MSYKYSNDYDEIIDVKADIEFIRNFLSLEQKDNGNMLHEQIRKIYELECCGRKLSIFGSRGKDWWYEEEFQLNYKILNMAHLMVECVKIEQLPNRYPNTVKQADEDYIRFLSSYETELINRIISVLTTCLWLFEHKGSNIIFGKPRNIDRYRMLYQELTSEQLELQEQGKQKVLPSLISTQK